MLQQEQKRQQLNQAIMPEHNDWTRKEEFNVRRVIENFLNNDDDPSNLLVYVFPTRMGWRRRKLIHHVASKPNLFS